MSDPILLRQDLGPVSRLTLNNPGKLNALSDPMLAALSQNLAEIASDSKIRVVVIEGAGKAFCAGHDLREMQNARQNADGGQAAFADLFSRCAAVMKQIRTLPQPVIAKVHGIATAAGCQLVATCDLAVADSETRFGVNGVNIGLFCSTPMVALSRNIGRKKAFELLTTGGFLSAEEAESAGLINNAVAADALEGKVSELAETIAGKLGAAVKIGKRVYYDQLEMPLDEAYGLTGDAIVENMMVDDTDEGINAFLEKRSPDWSQ